MSKRKIIYKSDVQLKPLKSIPASIRRRAHNLLLNTGNKEKKENNVFLLELNELKLEYRKDLNRLLGSKNMSEFITLKSDLQRSPRSRRLRECRNLIEKLGIDLEKVAQIKATYLDAASKLQKSRDIGYRNPPPASPNWYSPWVTYEAPFNGTFLSFGWGTSDGAKTPTIIRHLNNLDGQIGSSIETVVDDDGDLDADCYTALNVWHTTLSPGPLECYLVFEFNNSSYSGETHDEFGLSHTPIQQGAAVSFKVFNSDELLDSQLSTIFKVLKFDHGDDDSWNEHAVNPTDLHWYHFKTTASFEAGSLLLLQAGIHNWTHIWADNVSVKTFDDIDLRLDRIKVRSYEPE